MFVNKKLVCWRNVFKNQLTRIESVVLFLDANELHLHPKGPGKRLQLEKKESKHVRSIT